MRNKYVGEDVRQRLGGTVIRYRNIPYYCTVEGRHILLENIVTRHLEHTINFDDPELDISSLDLGYINIVNPVACAVHASRIGQRRYKQGVDLRALSYDVLTLPSEKFALNADYMFCQGFVDAYQGKYPSVSDALKMVSKTHRSVALSNDVAILRDKDIIKVYVKTEEIGWMKAGINTVNIPKSETSWMYQYYLEKLDGWKIVEGVGVGVK